MNHLTETQLNEYLDKTLSTAKRRQVEAHLSGCAACRAELASLQTVFQALAALPEAAPARDLAPSIRKSLSGSQLALGWRLVLAVQAGLALGIFILFGRLASGLIRTDLDLRPAMQTGINLFGQVSLSLPKFDFRLPALPAIRLPIPVPAAVILLVVVLILFGLGNSRLLRNGSSENQ
jgi:predicted anti-sigma-YlaC factor YlaD